MQQDMKLRDVMVFDYDGTLTLEDGVIPKETVEMLSRVHQKNLAELGIVSGRDLDFLMRTNESIGNLFSFLVAENGAISYFLDTNERIVRGEEWSKKAREVFANVGYSVNFYQIILTASVVYTEQVSETLKVSGLESKVVLNKDSVMVMPPTVDKGTGVSSAIAHIGPTKPLRVTCFGDGENDEALFAPADRRIAVSNAVPSLKLIADQVTTAPGGLGIIQYLTETFPEIKER